MAEVQRRLFFALWPDAAVAASLHELAQALQRACGGRATRRDSLHLTLAFLGGVPTSRLADAEAAADAVLADRFVLDLDRVACWKHNRIVWAGCSAMPPALGDVAAQLATNLRAAGFSLDARPFAVHASLVRKANCGAPLPPLDAAIAWRAIDFALVESHAEPGGSRYQVVRRWTLH